MRSSVSIADLCARNQGGTQAVLTLCPLCPAQKVPDKLIAPRAANSSVTTHNGRWRGFARPRRALRGAVLQPGRLPPVQVRLSGPTSVPPPPPVFVAPRLRRCTAQPTDAPSCCRCDCCKRTYCLEHRTYAAHRCKAAGQKQGTTIVCPLCAKAIKVAGDEDVMVMFDR